MIPSPLHSRKRQEQPQQQQWHGIAIMPSPLASRRKKRLQLKDRKKTFLYRTIVLVIVTTFFYGHSVIFPKAQDPSPGSVSANETNKQTEPTVNYHMVFSTDCSPYQRWQSYFFFYNARKVKQPGKITRIASGCTDEEAEIELKWHTQLISKQMSQDYLIHLTPHFTSVKDESGKNTGENYEFFNKPFGLLHWMEHSPDMGFQTNTDTDTDEEKHKIRDDTIVLLLDPDMVLTSPMTRDFPLDPARHSAVTTPRDHSVRPTRVTHGTPFAQQYGFSAEWINFDLAKVANDPATPALKLSREEARTYFSVGPPYLATAADMYRLAVKWAEFVPRMYHQHSDLLAEMYAFCIAAAHLELPHQVMTSLMISDTEINNEGWQLFEEDVSHEDMCGFATEKAMRLGEVGVGGKILEADMENKTLHLPGVVHYCQRYMLEKWFYAKRRVPRDFPSCDRPLLVTPPSNLGTLYDFRIPPPSQGKPNGGEKKMLNNKKQIKREAFALCFMIQAMNGASMFYKENNCKKPNLEKAMLLWEEPQGN